MRVTPAYDDKARVAPADDARARGLHTHVAIFSSSPPGLTRRSIPPPASPAAKPAQAAHACLRCSAPSPACGGGWGGGGRRMDCRVTRPAGAARQ